MKITIGRKLTLVTAINLTLLAVVSVIAYLASMRVTHSTEAVTAMLYKMEKIDQLQFTVVESIKMNDFLISGDLEKKTAFELSHLAVDEAIRDAEGEDLDLKEKTALSEIEHQFTLLSETTDKICEEAAKSDKGFLDSSVDALVEYADGIASSIVEITECLHDSLHEEVTDAIDKNERAKQLSLLLISVTSVSAVLLGIGGAILLSRSITKPIRALASTARTIAEGNYEERAEVTSRDEIGRFAAAFNNMSETISLRTNELVQANDNLQEEVVQRKEAEDALRHQKANLDAIFNAAPVGMLLIDENVLVKRINSVAAKLVGKDSASIVNSAPGLGLGCIHSMEEARGCGQGGFCSECPMRKAIEKVLDSGETVRGSEFESTFLVNGAETDLWLEISAEPMNLDGRRHVIMAINNISDRKAREKELREVHEDLVLASNRAGMAEVATDVIHNVGNILNSVNISTTMIGEIISNSKVPNLKKVAGIIQEHADDICRFLSEDPQGKHIPGYLPKLAELLTDEQAEIGKELLGLSENIEHIKETIKMQQSYSKVAGVEVASSIAEVVENAIQINDPGLEKYGVTFVRESAELPNVSIDKQRVLQILVNLIGNAKHAVAENEEGDKLITVRFYSHGKDRLHIQVADNGVGIPKERLSKIFGHGFTTKENGHGFGLHSGALAAKEMGGSLTAESDGSCLGATFTLEIPFRPVRVKV